MNAWANDRDEVDSSDRGGIAVVVVHALEVVRKGVMAMLGELEQIRGSRAMAAFDDSVVRVSEGLSTDVLLISLEARAELGPDIAALQGMRTLVVIPSECEHDLEQAAQVNADGYLMMEELDGARLRASLADVCNDHPHLPDCMTDFLLRMAKGPLPASISESARLSPRERDVYELVLEGQANKEIAASLGISIHGVKRHVSSILSKHNSPSRAHLVATVLGS